MKSLTSFLSHSKAIRDTSKDERFNRYLNVVRAFAADEELDADDVGLILEQAGRTEADLQSDVDKESNRIRLFQQLEERKRAERDVITLQRNHEELIAEKKAALERLDPAIVEAYRAISAKQGLIAQLEGIESQLVSGAFEIDIKIPERIRELRATVSQGRRQLQDLDHSIELLYVEERERKIEQLRREIKEAKRQDFFHDHRRAKTDLDNALQEIKHYKQRKKRFLEQRDPIQKEVDEAQREINVLERRLLEPDLHYATG